jgi:hypothetical protein
VEHQFQVVVVDVTETPVAPKKQRRCYSGKKKRHTLRTQLVVDQRTKQITCTAHGRGREHNVKLLNRSQTRLTARPMLLGDRGYQGVQKLHANSTTPRKKPPRHVLVKADRQANHPLARQRVISSLNIFHILADRYRNRRKRFRRRVNLIFGFYNLTATYKRTFARDLLDARGLLPGGYMITVQVNDGCETIAFDTKKIRITNCL